MLFSIFQTIYRKQAKFFVYLKSNKILDVFEIILLSRLKSFVKNKNSRYRWIAANLNLLYSKQRYQYISINDGQVSSNLSSIIIGVHQGSVSELLLFLAYINDLPNSCNSNLILYADYSVMIRSDRNTQNLKVKKCVKRIENPTKFYSKNYKQSTYFYNKSFSYLPSAKTSKNIFKLEVLKFIHKFIKKSLPKYFDNCFQSVFLHTIIPPNSQPIIT